MADVELSSLGSVIRPAYESQINGHVRVQTKAEFPAPVAGVITLAADTVYEINGNIDIGTDRIAVDGSLGLYGQTSLHDGITYSGVGNMFTVDVGDSFVAQSLDLACPNGTLVSFSGDGSGFFYINLCTLRNVNALGAVADPAFFGIDLTEITTAAAGFTFTGTGGGQFALRQNNLIGNVGTLFGLGTAIFQQFNISNNTTINTPSGSTFLSGATASANVGSRASVHANNFSGAGDVLGTITVQDLKWDFTGNAGIVATEVDAELYITTPETTVLADADVAVLIEGVYETDETPHRFTTTAAGRMTYDGLDPIRRKVDVLMNLAPTSGGAKLYEVCIVKNGVAISSSAMQATVASNTPQSVGTKALVDLVTDDYLEVFVTPIAHTQDAIADKLIFIVA